jgi:hypothetical protein
MNGNAENLERKRPREYGPVMGCLVFMPLMFIAAVLSFPYMCCVAAYWQWKEKRFAEQMAALGRTISFEEVVSAIENGNGTIILESYSAFKGPVRHWWVADDVFTVSPHPCGDRLTMAKDPLFQPFVEWCFRQYTSPMEGRGLLFVSTKAQRQRLEALMEKARSVEVPALSMNR